MPDRIKISTVRKLLPRRELNSHKGQNGRVMIVGGSIDYYGAPMLAGLGALNSGADLVHLYVPECNFDCTRSIYPDFFVHKYNGDFLTPAAVSGISDIAKEKCDSIVIGPGLGKREETLDAVREIVETLHIPTVLDADAIAVLKKIEKFPLNQTIVVTPHQNEFKHLVDRDVFVDEKDPTSIVLLRSVAMDLHINIIVKGRLDYVASDEGNVEINITGNPGMTVGGSGDVLAGVVGTFLAQGLEGFDAARCAAFLCGVSGDILKKKYAYNFNASDIAMGLKSLV